MTTAWADPTKTAYRASSAILRGSALFWFLIAFIGQWIFSYYIIFHYGLPLTNNGFLGLSKTYLKDSYLPENLAANVALVSHVIFAAAIHGLGPLQFIPHIRRISPRLHRLAGRLFLVAAMTASLSGLYIVWVRGTDEGWLADVTNTLIAVCVFFFGTMALHHAMAREFDAHRRWALRLFLAANAVWFIRIALFATGSIFMLTGVSFETYSSQVIAVIHIAKLLVPLGLLELYFRAQRSNKVCARISVAILIIVAAVFAGLGIIGISLAVWLPGARGEMIEL